MKLTKLLIVSPLALVTGYAAPVNAQTAEWLEVSMTGSGHVNRTIWTACPADPTGWNYRFCDGDRILHHADLYGVPAVTHSAGITIDPATLGVIFSAYTGYHPWCSENGWRHELTITRRVTPNTALCIAADTHGEQTYPYDPSHDPALGETRHYAFKVPDGSFVGGLAPLNSGDTWAVVDVTFTDLFLCDWTLWIGSPAPAFAPADFNRDGVVSVPDVFMFLACWFSADSRADRTGDADCSIEDVSAFLGEWFAGV